MTEEQLEATRWCATMPVHRRLLDTLPGYVDARTDIENQAFAWRRGRRQQVVTVPVVVHVVYGEESADISDEQVHSQIKVLNADFRMRNTDLERVPEPFQALAADARVEFALAGTDPDGAPSAGITRTRTDVAAFDADDTVKRASTGGADAWPADRYLNVWVCRLGGGLLGYAQFPGGPPETDGVVVTHQGFGTTGTATAPFNGGRTTVHEIGHWLNLRHIWGDDGEGCSGSDFVGDTPNQGGPNRGVPEFPTISCDNAPHGDLFVNFMDYSDDAATVMFTIGQAERMDACLAGPRRSFATSAGNAAEPGDLAPTAP
ncbi:zinc metalloprotease [Glycomyces tarimensis]